jgi:4-hydroxy-tetrahydrodipicolinate reductase
MRANRIGIYGRAQWATDLPFIEEPFVRKNAEGQVELCRRAAAALDGFDVEIIERHHNQKLDAPSGTAIMLADAVSTAKNGESEYVYERQSRRQKRDGKEIGIHSVRGGSIVGQHDVIFAGQQECITLSHTAESRSVFAEGALRAAKFMAGKKSGLYSMKDVISGII